MRMIFIGLILLTIFLTACTQVQITNFEECIAAGNPAMESYPRQCKAGDETFTEVIEEEVIPEEPEVVEEESGVTETELSMHDSESDCWIGYEGKVYDITDWLPKHPGSALVIEPYCGTSDDFESTFIGKHGKSKVEKLMQEGIYKGDLS